MRRREFIRIVGGTSVVTTIAPNYVCAKDSLSSDGASAVHMSDLVVQE